ncbi:MAG TPA: pyrimidine 5'-nucleotidase [Alphaproteobacteria bacterium]
MPTDLSHVESWIFDLDNTLYRVSPRLHAAIDDELRGFVAEFLGVDETEAHEVQKRYFREYGLTLRGLMVNHGLDPGVFFSKMRAVDLAEIEPDQRLVEAIAALPGRKFVYTNAPVHHAEAVLGRIGLDSHFAAVHDIIAAEFVPKPDVSAYRALCLRYRIEPGRAAMIDDVVANLAPAAEIGMTTVWMKTDAAWAKGVEPGAHVQHVVEDLAAWLAAVAASR